MRILFLILILLLTGCPTQQTTVSKHKKILMAYVQSYNGRDVPGMSELMHPDAQWLTVYGENIEIMADGKKDLTQQIKDLPTSARSQSSIGEIIETGPYLSVIETAVWIDNDGIEQSQSALVIYEMKDDLIFKVWYYPEVQ